MQVAQLNMSLDVPNASLKENTLVSFVHLSSVLFKRFSFKNSGVLLRTILFHSFKDSIFLVFVLSWLLNVNGSNGIEKCDVVTYWVQILCDHLGIVS